MSVTETDTIHWLEASDEQDSLSAISRPIRRRGGAASCICTGVREPRCLVQRIRQPSSPGAGTASTCPTGVAPGSARGRAATSGPTGGSFEDVASFVELATRDEDGAPAFIVGGCWGARPAVAYALGVAGRARGARARLSGAQGAGRPLAEGQAPGRPRSHLRRAPEDAGAALRRSCSRAIRSTSSSSATTRSACTR